MPIPLLRAADSFAVSGTIRRCGGADEFGLNIVEDKITIHDLQATILHCLGFDHTRLTYRHMGRDFSLTDIHGEVVRKMLA